MNNYSNIFYSFRRCPYAMRARLAIAASGQTCALREVVLRDKPEAMLEVSPKGTVPVLVLADGQVIDESLEIMLWALGENDPEGWLAPLVSDEAGTRALIADNDGPFKANLDRYKYPNRYDNVDPIEHRQAGLEFLQTLEQRLVKHQYLCGPSFTIVDAAIAPFVRQFANTDRDWFDTLNLHALQKWLETFLGSERFTRIMGKYPAWQEGDLEPVFPE